VSCGIPKPGPSEPFTLVPVARADVLVWFHVYYTKNHPTEADTFSKGWGDTRFSPISTETGSPIHTYYAASTAEGAYMESVLHEIPLSPPGQFDVPELQNYHLAQVQLPDPLDCVSFHTLYLPALGLTRAQLIDSLPACYAETRPWAEAAYRQQPSAQGIAYGSRRDDAARCLMLFGQRLPDPPLVVLQSEPLAVSPRREEVLTLIRRLKIREI
jgi:RES domain